MKRTIKLLCCAFALALSTNLHAERVFVSNGEFSTPDGASWIPVSGQTDGMADTEIEFPSTDGNPGGHAVMSNNGNTFGVLVAADGAEIPLGDLGLVAGESYSFFQDLRRFSGEQMGKLKIEFYNTDGFSGDTGDMIQPVIGDGSTWETYVYPVTIPAGTEAIKFVPVAGIGSSIGYDNIGVDNEVAVIPPGELIPNRDFEIPGGVGWGFFQGPETDHVVSYPATGGNPGGFAQIDATGSGGFSGLASNNNTPLAIETLGLTAGETYLFTVDMKIISGPNLGKFKVEFVPGGTGDLTADLIGDGSTWETYTFEVTLPESTERIFINPLWGEDSVIGYDNIGIRVPEEPRFDASIKTGTVVTWEPENEGSTYQPQRSEDGELWTNLGPAIQGTTINSAFDAVAAPFYRVREAQLLPFEAAFGGGFEFEDQFEPPCPENWRCVGTQLPERITDDARTGDASLRIAVQNDGGGAPNNSEIQQNLEAVGSFITAGETYHFSFWAKQIGSFGVSYVQRFRVQWLDFEGGELPAGGLPFVDFTGGTDEWVEITSGDLVAPEGATSALIQIFGATGAVAGTEARGEVLIDDLSLAAVIPEERDDLEAIPVPGVEICWMTEVGKSYQVEASEAGLGSFQPFGPVVTGDGEIWTAFDQQVPLEKFYRVRVLGGE